MRVTDDEVRQYYENTFVPEARRRGMSPIPALDDAVAAQIRTNVTTVKMMHEVDTWLDVTRKRSDIEVFH